MNFKFKKPIVISLVLWLAVQLSGCGTILQPERKGQHAGKLDPSIVVLNAIGLLFFVVPGVIAFAVDFNNGTIYLPSGRAEVDNEKMRRLHVQGELTDEKIEKAILAQTGRIIKLNDSDVRVIDNNDDALKNEVRFL
jgi:hypothetical protein